MNGMCKSHHSVVGKRGVCVEFVCIIWTPCALVWSVGIQIVVKAPKLEAGEAVVMSNERQEQ